MCRKMKMKYARMDKRRTQVTEPSVEPRITKASPIGAMAAAVIGTVTPLVAVLSIKALGAS